MRRHLLPVGALTVACGAVLWPAVSEFRSRYMLGDIDSSVFVWSWWHLPNSIGAGDSPYLTDQIFFPAGADLSMTTMAPFIALVTAPVRLAWGPIAQVNASQLLGAWMAAVATYLLVEHLTRHRATAVVVGLAYTFAPFRFVHLPDHLNLIHTGFLPLGVLLFLRVLQRPSAARAVWLGASIAAAFLTDPQVAVLTVTAVAAVGVTKRSETVEAWRSLAVSGAIGLAGAAPLLVPMMSGYGAGEGNTVSASAMVAYSADPSRWIVPPSQHRVFGALARDLLGSPVDEGIAYPGLLLLGLAAASLALCPRSTRRPWVAVTLVGAVLALGPFVAFRDDYVSIPLPFLALRVIPGLSSLRVPGRFIIVGILGLAVLGGLALVEVLRRWPNRRSLIVLACLAILAIDLWPTSLPGRELSVPAAYSAIAADDGDGAVLDIPLQWSTGEVLIGDGDRYHSIYMEYAIEHGQPMVGGYVSRYSDERLDALLEIPVYRQVLALQGEPGFEDEVTFDETDLAQLGIGYVTYNRSRPVPPVLAYLEELDLPVLADDGTVIVWRVRSSPSAPDPSVTS